MSYGCSSSGADGGFWHWLTNNSIIKSALKNDYDMPSTQYKSYELSDRWTIKANIDADQPVLLGGYTAQSHIFSWYWGSGFGHEWVCDGYIVHQYPCFSHFWYNMNWGWNGESNGVFYQTAWNTPNGNYNYQKDMVYNIHP